MTTHTALSKMKLFSLLICGGREEAHLDFNVFAIFQKLALFPRVLASEDG